ncbi:hypothetical protein OHA21_12705 [Actinoplanes sp. NBC_00393]|uniref:hypothetical protein n=1 Tax=Actinoplanes sp. NBC_00393 TaxID=2975953 RepID=UPI002E21C5B8
MNATDARPARWAVAAAYAVPLCVLPSALWRLTIDVSGLDWYMIFLSVLSMALALLTLGLVQPWGRRLPGWLGGRPVPARAAARLAITGGVLLVVTCGYFFLNQAFDLVNQGWSPSGMQDPVVRPRPGWDIMRFYVPLVLWGPLLIAVALDYRRRLRTVGN